MKKLLSLLALVCLVLTASASKVYFDNSDTKWDVVKAYFWDGDKSSAAWPGDAMTNEGNDIWSIEIQGTPGKIIFNNDNNGQQTGNLDFVDGATYDKNGVKGAELNEYTVYYDNTKTNWEIVKAYYWGGGAQNGWPGDDMTKGENNVWSITIKGQSAPENILFNLGGDSGKTADFKFVAGATYNFNGIVTTGGGDDPVDPTPDPEGVTVAIAGEFNEWSKTANTAVATAETQNCAVIVVENWKGGGFKAYIGTTWYGKSQELSNDQWFDYPEEGGMGNDYTLPAEANGKTVTFTVAADNGHIKAEWAGAAPTYPEVLYLETSNGADWDLTTGVAATGVEGVYTWDKVSFAAAGSYFFFTDKLPEGAQDWDNVGTRYGSTGSYDEPVELVASGASAEVVVPSGECWHVSAPAGQYRVVLNLVTKTVTLDKTTGVQAVEAAALCGDVYNVAGVCVLRGADEAAVKALPAGLYIVGGKKVLVK